MESTFSDSKFVDKCDKYYCDYNSNSDNSSTNSNDSILYREHNIGSAYSFDSS